MYFSDAAYNNEFYNIRYIASEGYQKDSLTGNKPLYGVPGYNAKVGKTKTSKSIFREDDLVFREK